MGTSVHGPLSEKEAEAPTPRLEAEVKTALLRNEEHGSFFAGYVIWFVIALPFWVAAIWWFFFR
jgi:hypothetical protein